MTDDTIALPPLPAEWDEWATLRAHKHATERNLSSHAEARVRVAIIDGMREAVRLDRAGRVGAGWQPIETRPNCAEVPAYLVVDKKGNVGYWSLGCIHGDGDWCYGDYIAHWMPLPTAPTTPPDAQTIARAMPWIKPSENT